MKTERSSYLKMSKILGYAVLVIIVFVLSIYYILSLLGVLNRFGLISDSNLLKISFWGSVAVCIVSIVVIVYRRQRPVKSKIASWVSLNYPRLVEFYCLSSIFFYCIKTELIFDVNDLSIYLSEKNVKLGYSFETIDPDKLTCTTDDASIANCYVEDDYVVINPKSEGQVKIIL